VLFESLEAAAAARGFAVSRSVVELAGRCALCKEIA
jgi:Fe2+ or Zn2+ uptake regulation protein